MNKKIIIAVGIVVGVVLVGVAVGAFGGKNIFFAREESSIGLCISGMNLQTDLDAKTFKTSPPGPLMAIYKDTKEYLLIYPIISLSNAPSNYYTKSASFTAKQTGWNVYQDLEDVIYGNPLAMGSLVGGPMPFIIASTVTPTDAIRADIRMFVDTMRPAQCPSPNPNEYNPPLSATPEPAEKKPAAPNPKPAVQIPCAGVDIKILEVKCNKISNSEYVRGSVVVKNQGTAAASGFFVNTENKKGSGFSTVERVSLAPGATHTFDLEGLLPDDIKVIVVPRTGDEICTSTQAEASIMCN